MVALCMFYKINCSPNHALEVALPRVFVPARLTRLAVTVYSRYFDLSRCRTVQFDWSFVPASMQLWNSLDEPCVAGDGVAVVKVRINRALLVA